MISANYTAITERHSPGTAGEGSPAIPDAPAAKRLYDIAFSLCGFVVLGPLFLAIAALIKLADGGPLFYRQRRIGLHGRPFLICKFRTMVPEADGAGPLVTGGADTRVTRVGRVLRKTKLDELPQLWNVLKGDMSLVGPRPEVPKYVAQYTPAQRAILNLKPGITDLASVHFRNEEMLLQHAQKIEDFYVQHCLPRKLQLNLEYAERSNLLSDTWIILRTLFPYGVCVLSVYSLVLAASFWLSCALVDNVAPSARPDSAFCGTLLAFVTVQLGTLTWRKQCKGLLSYFSLPELRQVVTALGFACLLLLGLWSLMKPAWPPPNLVLVDCLVSFCALCGFRVLLRHWRETATAGPAMSGAPCVRVGIIGADEAGSQLARGLAADKQSGRTVVAFFDDASEKWHRRIHEIPVIGMPECLLDGWSDRLDEVFIVAPDAASNRFQELARLLEVAGLKVNRAPSARNLWRSTNQGSPGRSDS